ncbi:MAG TPA: YcxB family protein [Polyangiaceae bacterium]
MTSDAGAATGHAQLDAPSAEFEGAPIVGCTELRVEDFTSAWAALPQNRRVFVRFGLWLLAIPLFGVYQLLLNESGPHDASGSPWPVVALSLGVAGALFGFALWRDRTVWARNAVADLRGAEGVEFRFDALGFSFQAPGRHAQHTWDSLYRCIETANAFAIYTGPIMVMIVPKRAFAASELDSLRARLLERVPNRALRGTELWQPWKLVLWIVLVVAFLVIWQLLEPGVVRPK